jgi:UDP-N-acetylmuramate: L-alanyl-gamma-D-glutamyl-meso-diaminopimelate ligase
VVTSVEFDHADIFADLQAVEEAFLRLVRIIPHNGLLVTNADDPGASNLSQEARCRLITYGLREPADFKVEEVDYKVGTTCFHVRGPQGFRASLTSPLPGAHNLSNTMAMVVLGHELGLSVNTIQEALNTFEGVRRRQEIRGDISGVTVIDDFAHHPTAVQSTIEALRPFYGGRRLWAIFEPRTNSSKRRVFQQRYAAAFDSADLVIIKQPPAVERIAPEERLSTKQLVEDVRARGVEALYFPDVDTMLPYILSQVKRDDVLLVMSTGSFDGLIDRLLKRLKG